jgi:hypothetical protein
MLMHMLTISLATSLCTPNSGLRKKRLTCKGRQNSRCAARVSGSDDADVRDVMKQDCCSTTQHRSRLRVAGQWGKK